MIYYLSESLDKSINSFNAGNKARNDINLILNLAFKYDAIKIHEYEGSHSIQQICTNIYFTISDWINILIKVSRNDTLIIQYPLPTYAKVAALSIPFVRLIHSKGVKIILFVHDVQRLQYNGFNNDEFFFSISDVIISHNKYMTSYIKQFTSAKIFNLEIFDYLIDGNLSPANINGIDIAGNLDPSKAQYIYKASRHLPGLPLNLYGANFVSEECNIDWYRGKYLPDELVHHLTGKFGLVWNGNSIDGCDGVSGEYLRYNNPHKLSLFLALGKPVFIWSAAAEADFVVKHGVGFAVDNLYQVIDIYNSLANEQYIEICSNVHVLSERLRSGFYTKKAISKAVEFLS